MRTTAFIAAFVGLACLHPPRSYKGSLEETGQQAVIFFADGREELVLRVDYKLGPEGKLPETLAWVVPTPTVPDHYAVASPKALEDLFRFGEDTWNLERGRNSLGEDQHSSIELLAKVTVGEYEIQPIRATGREAGPELNAWLTRNDFGEVPQANMQYYLDHGWTFLAIKILKDKAKESLEAEGGFRPLRIGFATDRIVYPLKFSSHQGTFDVTLYLVTPAKLDVAEQVKPFGFRFEGEAAADLKALEANYPDFAALWSDIRKDGKVTFSKGSIAKLIGERINRNDAPVADWKEDFSIAAK